MLMPIVMSDEDAAIRYRLRLARTQVQVHTQARGHRQRTLWAALEQFEQLLDAAGVVGPAARPLPLFYAVSQAGRAITAAHGLVPWELRGHGLEMPSPSSRTPLLERTIEPKPRGNDSFHRVAETIGSDVLTGPVQLGAVWASLPNLLPEALAQEWPRPLSVSEIISIGSDTVAADVMGLEDFTADDIGRTLAQYPRAQGWELSRSRQVGEHPFLDVSPPVNVWSRASSTAAKDRLAKLDEFAPEYRWSRDRWLRPGVGPQRDYLKPLCAWWILLYSLSMVARYEPAEWAEVLDINRSDLAVAVESLLDIAMLIIPQLVLEAIERQPVLTRRGR